jgi:signal peptidase I
MAKGFASEEFNRVRNRDVVIAIIIAFVIAFLIKTFVFDLVISEGDSMEPAVTSGSLLAVNRLAYGVRNPFTGKYLIRWAAPKKGSIVIFYTPQGDLAVKRCEGVKGTSFDAQGDNSAVSYDSDNYGPVPLDNIVGRVLNHK